ncbi:hypothetical protein KIF53_13350 [Chromobacterium subtsugae]|uniref:Holin n=1 Tax=Chromobacterium subtsugae TaxID=251747 RepID=A0ABS7FEV2_9NEIS|nr:MULTISPECIES: hypothetical protein [Chromobacterium]KUM03515.1 hypothetical protein Cv017_19290 [Chromobacterium subtsugae]KZE87566.1 hypothetical protein AWB61_10280 [Chromobacterium sp. F49]MBW7567066.1 hypothetical protein [Chromobacterium subtsugae]MBW8288615.1 hypothetical protein [Chromobacterium subtsugae]WSE90158.1 hypothetical protein U6115_14810 [Chromobacterium subtsugae]
MTLADLATNPTTGRLSHSKLWANVACAVATGMFVYQGVAGTLTAEVWLIYLGVVGGYSAARSWIAAQRDAKGGGNA